MKQDEPGDGDLMNKNLSASVRKRALSFGWPFPR